MTQDDFEKKLTSIIFDDWLFLICVIIAGGFLGYTMEKFNFPPTEYQYSRTIITFGIFYAIGYYRRKYKESR